MIFPTYAFAMTSAQRPDQPPAGGKSPRGSGLGALAAPWLMVAAVGLGVIGGLAIDRHWQIAPWGLLGCALFGLIAGVYLVYREGTR